MNSTLVSNNSMGIRLKLTLPLVLMWGILFSAFHFYWLPAYFEKDIARYRLQQEQKIDLLFSGLLEPMLRGDLAHVYSAIETAMYQQREWLNITVWDSDNIKIFPLEDRSIIKSIYYQTIDYQQFSTGNLIVKVNLVADPNLLLKEQHSQVVKLRWLFFSIFIISIGTSILLEEHLVRKPIAHLADAANRLGRQDFSAQLPKAGHDEIGKLILNFDSMRNSLRSFQEDLEMARDEALSATKAKSHFLAKMSHELRTPLNAVIGYSEVIKDEMDDHETHKHNDDLDKISGAGRHLLSLINDLLDLSKIEAGKEELYIEHISLSALLDEVTATIQPLAHDNNNTIALKLTHKHDHISTDSRKLRQILLNILSNACKFTENGQIEIHSTPYQHDHYDYFKITITDSGIGIPQDRVGELFEAFTQIDPTCTQKHKGTGLGLAICYQLCALMKGKIEINSEPGVGSTCCFCLPVDLFSVIDASRSQIVKTHKMVS